MEAPIGANIDRHAGQKPASLFRDYALYSHQMVAQMPASITCFTDRRSPRARQRVTPVGRLIFVCVRSSVYVPAGEAAVVSPAQALCDYVYLCRRHGAEPEALVTFRNLAHIRAEDLAPILARYPTSVQKHAARLWETHTSHSAIDAAEESA